MMSLLRKGFATALFFTCVSFVQAQEFGGFPPSFRWRQINTDTVRIIFPYGLHHQAERIAGIIHYMVGHNTTSIGAKDFKINIVLQNQTVLSNGYVGLAPFRSEFYTTPLQESGSLGSMNWLDLLALHEYRHVLQYSNSRRGLSRFMYWINGQLGWAGSVGLSVPNWFFEGDAVVNETSLSKQGRGRLPEFYNPYRSVWLSGRKYSYAKARNNSLKDFVPDHYRLGYLLCTYGRNKYGNTFWKDVFGDAAEYKGLFYPFSRAIYRHTPEQYNVKRFYDSAISDYYRQWQNEADTLDITRADHVNLNTRKKNYTTRLYPQFVSDSQWVVLKASFKKIAAFYLVDKRGKEKRLTVQGYTTDNYFSYKNGMLCWSEYNFHPRWGWYDYSVIKTYNIKTGVKRKITCKSKYFSPDLSPDLSRIVVAESTPGLKYSLKVIDAATGALIKQLPNPDSLYFSYPKWSVDGQKVISAARTREGEMALIEQNVATGEISLLTGFSNNIVGISYPTADYIYFEASYSGIDNIYRVKPGDTRVYKVTSRKIGNYEPSVSPDGKVLMFSEYSVLGNDIYTSHLNDTAAKAMYIIPLSGQKKFDMAGIQSEGGSILDKLPARHFQDTIYPKTKGLINIHSWAPYYTSPEYGAYIYSDNILNTFSASAGLLYNNNEQSKTVSLSATYGGLFPYLGAGASYTRDRSAYNTNNQRYWWDETNVYAGLSVPINLTKGIFSRSFQVASYYRNSYTFNYSLYDLATNRYLFSDYTSSINSLQNSVLFFNSRKKAQQNIYTRFGQYVSVTYNQAIDNTKASQWKYIGDYAFPGLFQNHNFVLESGYLSQNNNSLYRFSNTFYYARGYTNSYVFDNIYRLGFNYHFPIVYPDMGLLGIIYVQRIRGNVFYDFSSSSYKAEKADYTNLYRSTGFELIFDAKFFNAQPFTFGFRYIYRIDPVPGVPLASKDMVEFFIPVKRL